MQAAKRIAAVSSLALLAVATTALADDGPASEPVPVPQATTGEFTPVSDRVRPEAFDDHLAIEDWNAQRRWSYGTDRLMPLTRGLPETGLPPAARWPLYLFTVPFDLVQLPVAAIGGLYGN
ncbi:MAG: hypothetical protein VX546_13770 [Myxococcota bacterium]|nr:hypothetical protein [Myxococcota bacterium]